jgi:hypothetical protein
MPQLMLLRTCCALPAALSRAHPLAAHRYAGLLAGSRQQQQQPRPQPGKGQVPHTNNSQRGSLHKAGCSDARSCPHEPRPLHAPAVCEPALTGLDDPSASHPAALLLRAEARAPNQMTLPTSMAKGGPQQAQLQLWVTPAAGLAALWNAMAWEQGRALACVQLSVPQSVLQVPLRLPGGPGRRLQQDLRAG